MTEPRTLTLAPGFWGGYRTALFSRRQVPVIGDAVPPLPDLQLVLAPQPPDAARLARYRALCGFVGPADTLPITWPQVLAGSLHLSLLADARFPYPILGVVHVKNEITQGRPLPAAAALGLSVRTAGSRPARRGVEFDLITEASVAGEDPGEPPWRAITTVLVPGQGQAETITQRAPEPAGDAPGRTRSLLWRLPADQGRRYASVSGDYNPIHLTALTARPFGFPSAILHGMWSLARACAELHDDTIARGGAWRLSCAFKRPLLLPSTVRFSSGPTDGGQAFALRAASKGNLLLEGALVPV